MSSLPLLDVLARSPDEALRGALRAGECCGSAASSKRAPRCGKGRLITSVGLPFLLGEDFSFTRPLLLAGLIRRVCRCTGDMRLGMRVSTLERLAVGTSRSSSADS